MSRREEVGVSFVALGILEPQISTPLVLISRHLAPFDELGWKVITLLLFAQFRTYCWRLLT
jgi:hypothetical protein